MSGNKKAGPKSVRMKLPPMPKRPAAPRQKPKKPALPLPGVTLPPPLDIELVRSLCPGRDEEHLAAIARNLPIDMEARRLSGAGLYGSAKALRRHMADEETWKTPAVLEVELALAADMRQCALSLTHYGKYREGSECFRQWREAQKEGL